jgi:hypothetical protein
MSAWFGAKAGVMLAAVAVRRREILSSSGKSSIHLGASVVLCAALLVSSQPALAQFTQQGSKLIGTGAVGAADQGYSIALSADGNTAIVGGPTDNVNAGAAWVYTGSGGVWSQQGSKLVGTGAVGTPRLGSSIALSADGNTAIIGAPTDNTQNGGSLGAAWVFTRSNGVWSQQGGKLVGTGFVGGFTGAVSQGTSVAVSADGNTAIIGAPQDNADTGAVWVFTRSGGVWTQQGSKLVGTGAVGNATQGWSVALSANGNTAIAGGNVGDNSFAGAAWVFTRSGGVWTQQGNKLVGTGAVGTADQGFSVALSSDGNTVIMGGPVDNGDTGAMWVFTRSGGVWTQQGSKLVGVGAAGSAEQGYSVALSADGNTAIMGGFGDNANTGAAWVFTRSSGVWSQQGSKLVGTGAVGAGHQGQSVALSADGATAMVGGNNDNGFVGAAWVYIPAPPLSTATHDFNGDGKSDILWRNSDGTVGLWLMNGTQVVSTTSFGILPTSWTIVGTGDFNGDGKTDILWRNADGTVGLWLMNGAQILSTTSFGVLPTSWSIFETGDFNGDGKSDILWRNSDGTVGLWFMNGTQVVSTSSFGVLPTSWTIQGTNAD